MSESNARVREPFVRFDIGQIIPIYAADGEALGVSFVRLQANRQAAPAMSPTLADHLPTLLEQFRQAYAAHGRQSFVVGAIERGAVFQPSDWLPLACAVQGGGTVLLVKDNGETVEFWFFVVLGLSSGKGPCEEAVATFLNLAAEAGAHLTHEDRASLGIVLEGCAEAAWLTFVMTRLLGSQFIVELIKGATLLITPFAACVKVLEDVARARQAGDEKVAEGGQAESQKGRCAMSSTPGTSEETAQLLHQIAAAFRKFERLVEETRDAKAEPDSSEREELIERQIEAAVAALDLAARNLRLLNNCRLTYGCAPETRDLFFAIEGFASLTTTERMQDAGEFVRRFKSYRFPQLHPNTEWAHELERWAGELEQAASAASNTPQSAEPTAEGGKADSKEQPWADDAPEYLPNTEALKLADEDQLDLKKLGRLLTPKGEIRFMRKGRRCKVHIGDFRRYLSAQKGGTITDEAIDDYLRGVEQRKQEVDRSKRAAR